MIRENIEAVKARIARASARCGRDPHSVKLVCVTKNVPVDGIEEVLALGVEDIGESRVQEAVLKHGRIGTRAVWHLIGHLQTNKVRGAPAIFSLIHSLDSERLAKAVDSEARTGGKVQDALVEVNISGESQKYGLRPEDVPDFIDTLTSFSNLRVVGLMGIAPIVSRPEHARPYFRTLKEIFDAAGAGRMPNVEMKYLSMGMSQDFEVAIEEGANIVRIGTAIFGE